MGFFNTENTFFRTLAKIWETIYLSFLWILCSIPIITAGAATMALYYTVNKTIKHERGYVSSEFFSSFRSNFKQSTIVWLILLVIFTILGIDYFAILYYTKNGHDVGAFQTVFLVLAILTLMWSLYIFPYMARFENTIKDVLKNTLIIALSNAPYSIIMLVLFLAACLAIYKVTPIIFVIPVMYNSVKNFVIERVFKKYMKAEDLELEEERNRVYYN